MFYEVLHLMLSGKEVKANIRQSHIPLLEFCNFEDGRTANITNINNTTYVYTFDNGETMTFRNDGSRRIQINNSN